jgi:abortive infection bacteriophage resistance protein
MAYIIWVAYIGTKAVQYMFTVCDDWKSVSLVTPSDKSKNQVFAIYEFDRKFRHILFTAIEEIEVNFRARLAYFHAHKYGADGYLSSKNFNIKHDHQKFLSSYIIMKSITAHFQYGLSRSFLPSECFPSFIPT